MDYKEVRYESQEKLKKCWGEFLSGLSSWDWWVTLTFRDRSKEEQERGWTKVGTHYAARAFKIFIKEIQKETKTKVKWVCGLEYQRWRGVPHYHALIQGVSKLRRLDWMDWWYGRYGIARIVAYNPKQGASRYISKYVSKELGEINFSESLTNPSSCVTSITRRGNKSDESDSSKPRGLEVSDGGINPDGRAYQYSFGQDFSGGDGQCHKR